MESMIYWDIKTAWDKLWTKFLCLKVFSNNRHRELMSSLVERYINNVNMTEEVMTMSAPHIVRILAPNPLIGRSMTWVDPLYAVYCRISLWTLLDAESLQTTYEIFSSHGGETRKINIPDVNPTMEGFFGSRKELVDFIVIKGPSKVEVHMTDDYHAVLLPYDSMKNYKTAVMPCLKIPATLWKGIIRK